MEEKDSWTEKSRYGTLREFTFHQPNCLEVICKDTLYCSFSGHPDFLTAIDPDGGPYLSIGGRYKSYTIKKIISHEFDKKTLKIILEVDTVLEKNDLK